MHPLDSTSGVIEVEGHGGSPELRISLKAISDSGGKAITIPEGNRSGVGAATTANCTNANRLIAVCMRSLPRPMRRARSTSPSQIETRKQQTSHRAVGSAQLTDLRWKIALTILNPLTDYTF
jgi:hypothetical protein